jgi:putative flippase GtrA
MAATALAVEASVLNNFVWHRKWTWADRPRSNAAVTLLRFNLTAGAMSMAGNLFLMWLLVSAAGLGALRANLISILICSVINFMLNDRLVFV